LEHTPLEIENYVSNNLYRLSLSMEIDSDMDEYDIKKQLIEYYTKYPEQMAKMSPRYIIGPKSYMHSLNNIGGTYQNKYL